VNWSFARSPCFFKWSIISGMNCSYIPFAASYIPLWTSTSVFCKRIYYECFGVFTYQIFLQHNNEFGRLKELFLVLTSNLVGSKKRFACQDDRESEPCNNIKQKRLLNLTEII
jgi:hypothetical protein